MVKPKNKNIQFFLLLLVLLLLPVLIYAGTVVVQMISRASGVPANLKVDTNSDLGSINKNWQALAQGGEEKNNLLTGVVSDVRRLSPSYIRIDHIYDLYEVVRRSGDGRLEYDFSRLDKVVDDILSTGALPFISVSYMPGAISESDVTGRPKNWSDWRETVKKTVEHYSGRGSGQKNLNNVYYEVWNEPDLFGKWKTYGDKNYLELYRETVMGAAGAQNINNYKIGGPATTGLYTSWMQKLLDYCRSNSLKIDFLSYHRYSMDLETFVKDSRDISSVLINYPEYQSVQIIVSEWGSDAENNPVHDTNFDAIHTIAAIRKMIDRVNMAFTFEIKDGPGNREFWGRWGLITHDTYGLHKKPKYHAIGFLNMLDGQRLAVEGEGTFVSALSAKRGDTVKVLLVNYDREQKNQENVPLLINNLPNGNYSVKTFRFLGDTTQEYVTVENGLYNTNIYLPPQSAAVLELTKLSAIHSYSLGYFGGMGLYGLRLGKSDLPFRLSKQEYGLTREGTMEFLIKPDWIDDNNDIVIFNMALDGGRELLLKKTTTGFQKKIEFGSYINSQAQNTVSVPADLDDGQWHHVVLVWSPDGFLLNIDGNIQKTGLPFEFNISGDLLFNNFGGVIDELRILNIADINIDLPKIPYERDSTTLILRHFDKTDN